MHRVHEAMLASNYQIAIDVLAPILDSAALKKQLSMEELCGAEMIAADCYSHLQQFDLALVHAQRSTKLARRKHGFRSQEYAMGLWMIGIIQRERKMIAAARKAITEAISIMKDSEDKLKYGGLLCESICCDQDCGMYAEALATCGEAIIVLDEHTDSEYYSDVLNASAICYHKLKQWPEAFRLYMSAAEAARDNLGQIHCKHATVRTNMALFLRDMKQYELALKWFDQVLAITEELYDEQDPCYLRVLADIAETKQLIAIADRGSINVGHDFRMCNWCSTISDRVNTCPCVRAWYCDAECQLNDWPAHKPNCNVCMVCDKFLDTVLRCSRCKRGKYCGPECSKADWLEHKKDCVKKE